MAGVTEIYICKLGQKLKDGKLEISHSITTRDQADDDARQRCKMDKKIHKVAYYSVTEDGNFRSIYTYTNRKAAAKPPPPAKPEPKKARRPKPKPTLVERVMSVFK